METGDRLMTTDKLPIASITKLFTATAVMRLADNGSLSIDDPVIKYLPYFKVQGDYTKITLRHLLTHSSGLPVILPEKEWLREDSSTGALEATVRGLENIELNSQPGTQFGYSNLGYIVLSDIVAKVSKMEFEAYVTANILEPLRMHNSNFITSSPSTVAAHTKQGQKVIPINGHVENKGTNGAGGLESSIADLCTWAMMALGNGTLNETEIVKATTFKMMIEPQVLEYTDNKAYEAHRGFGWQVLRYENEPYFGHAGRYKFGGRSMLFILPEKALGIVFVANLTFNEEFDLLTDIEKMIDR
jgi:CubicO group peptidase (beta-lactamase class C family)